MPAIFFFYGFGGIRAQYLLLLFVHKLGFRRRDRRAGHPERGLLQGQHAHHAAAAGQPDPVDLRHPGRRAGAGRGGATGGGGGRGRGRLSTEQHQWRGAEVPQTNKRKRRGDRSRPHQYQPAVSYLGSPQHHLYYNSLLVTHNRKHQRKFASSFAPSLLSNMHPAPPSL